MTKQELEGKMIEEIKKSDLQFVNTEYLAKKVGISWSRASRMLLRLALQGKITAMETTNGYVFSISQNNEPKITPRTG